MANAFTRDLYVEKIDRLALGVEPVDAGRAGRVGAPVRVQLEDVPQPFTPRPVRPGGCAFDAGLPDIDRHPSSRYALIYPTDPARLKRPVTIRLFDCGRWYVPRRLRIRIPSHPQLLTGESSTVGPVPPAVLPPRPPLANRMRRPVLFPGAAYQTDASVTGLRGRILRGGKPMRWARVEAHDPASGTLLGRAHGDDRGDFFLIVGSVATPNNVVQLTDPVPTEITVFGPAVVPVPASADPDRLDPLWDLPIEIVPALGAPDDVSPGEVQPPGYQDAAPVVVQLPVGRVTSAIAPFVFA